ncbi:MAG: hypothetical protein PHI88_02120 [Candidatus Pacebacteria bacterium]|nr:hypothetical protein [Candidatus Paceibacterota bacterium]
MRKIRGGIHKPSGMSLIGIIFVIFILGFLAFGTFYFSNNKSQRKETNVSRIDEAEAAVVKVEMNQIPVEATSYFAVKNTYIGFENEQGILNIKSSVEDKGWNFSITTNQNQYCAAASVSYSDNEGEEIASWYCVDSEGKKVEYSNIPLNSCKNYTCE